MIVENQCFYKYNKVVKHQVLIPHIYTCDIKASVGVESIYIIKANCWTPLKLPYSYALYTNRWRESKKHTNDSEYT